MTVGLVRRSFSSVIGNRFAKRVRACVRACGQWCSGGTVIAARLPVSLRVVHVAPGRFVPLAGRVSRYLLSLYRRLRRTHEQLRLDRFALIRRQCFKQCEPVPASAAYCHQFSELYCPADATAFAFYGKRFPRSNVDHTLN